MFKVSEKKNVGMILTPDWSKTSSRRLSFKGFKAWSDEQYCYVALFNCNAVECKQWKPNDDPSKSGEWIDITSLPNPVLLRFLKKEITYKGQNGKPDNTIKPSGWDLFFIDQFDELASQYPDGLAEGVLDCTESNLGMANRWKVETNEAKKAVFKEAFLDIKPVDGVIEGLDEYSFEAIENKGNGSRGNYTPKETTTEILQARLNFVKSLLAETIGEEDDTLPLSTLVVALRGASLGEASLCDFKEFLAMILGEKI